jgi:hypothetical protein
MEGEAGGGGAVVRAFASIAVSCVAALLLVLAGDAAANHNVTELLSIGPTGGNGGQDARFVGASADGTRVFFITGESLVSEDTDVNGDLYVRAGGTTTLVSAGGPGTCTYPPSGCDVVTDPRDGRVSADGHRVFFRSLERLDSTDTDSFNDLYEWHDGVISLVSTGPTDPGVAGSNYGAGFAGASQDGTHVYFVSWDRLVTADLDSNADMYERTGGTTSLVSTGTGGGTGTYEISAINDVADDGSRIFFETNEPIVLEDLNSATDVYEGSAGSSKLVSVTSSGTTNNSGAHFDGASADGTRVFFDSFGSYTPEDTDTCHGETGCIDVYERSAGTTKLVSTGPGPISCPSSFGCHASFKGISKDGTRVFFNTVERLTSAPTGGLYERSGGTTTLLFSGADRFMASDDGSHLFFTTNAVLDPADTDPAYDVYEYFNGTVKLASTGPTDPGECCFNSLWPQLRAISPDGLRVFFETPTPLVAADTDGGDDFYERHGGETTLITAGPTGSPGFSSGQQFWGGLSQDAKRVFFSTPAALVQGDLDSNTDVYERRIGYVAPQSASTLMAALVPVFRQCGTGGNTVNALHAPPLAVGSCTPPAPRSSVARVGSESVGSVQLTVVPGDFDPGNGDQADVTIAASLSDVLTTAGADYAPDPSGADVTLAYAIRNTDLDNCTGCATPSESPGTAADLDFSVPINCAPRPGPAGSTCAVNTTADSVVANAIHEQKQTISQVFRLRLNDAGVNGVRGDGDDRVFAQQGLFVP